MLLHPFQYCILHMGITFYSNPISPCWYSNQIMYRKPKESTTISHTKMKSVARILWCSNMDTIALDFFSRKGLIRWVPHAMGAGDMCKTENPSCNIWNPDRMGKAKELKLMQSPCVRASIHFTWNHDGVEVTDIRYSFQLTVDKETLKASQEILKMFKAYVERRKGMNYDESNQTFFCRILRRLDPIKSQYAFRIFLDLGWLREDFKM